MITQKALLVMITCNITEQHDQQDTIIHGLNIVNSDSTYHKECVDEYIALLRNQYNDAKEIILKQN